MTIVERKIFRMFWKINFNELKFFSGGSTIKNLSGVTDGSYELDQEDKFQMSNFKDLHRGQNKLKAFYKGMVVSVYYSNMHSLKLTREDLVELVQMKELQYDNLVPFLGACSDDDRICYIVQHCSRGTLQQHMRQIKQIRLNFKGMALLHKSFVQLHKKLTSYECMVDNRWVVKITGFGLRAFKSPDKINETLDESLC
ncbi:hypothetical protein HELRODRAFT_163853 [Helobdella robusta]|uniref:guanylate cyclase n=1 Tax=Helobdella robusta TaxID=6412 RepID=T1EUJ4_HELRO|nr:hypothetical protein HELRODRAFT_163853 [Helobdella robusta]ESN96743.1 hypothetical protein HELRODRAFT_163853 [Helobdella robusta]